MKERPHPFNIGWFLLKNTVMSSCALIKHSWTLSLSLKRSISNHISFSSAVKKIVKKQANMVMITWKISAFSMANTAILTLMVKDLLLEKMQLSNLLKNCAFTAYSLIISFHISSISMNVMWTDRDHSSLVILNLKISLFNCTQKLTVSKTSSILWENVWPKTHTEKILYWHKNMVYSKNGALSSSLLCSSMEISLEETWNYKKLLKNTFAKPLIKQMN